MVASIASAISAYANSAGTGGIGGLDARDQDGPSFGDILKQAGSSAMDTLKAGESATTSAALGKADTTDVVTAVTNAETTLQTMVAVRDKVLAAYQSVMSMTI